MAYLTPKEFMKQVFVTELEKLSNENHYISFAIMATGIEFLGKCLDNSAPHWNVSGRSEQNFKYALENLKSLERYKPYKDILYTDLRCGFAHSFVPKKNLTLSSKNEMPHMETSHGRLNLKCEDFYNDFKNACLEVIDMDFQNTNDKMNKDLLFIPADTFIYETNIPKAITESLQR